MLSGVGQVAIHDFYSVAADDDHLTGPLHRVMALQLFFNALLFGHQLYQPVKHFLCLSVNRDNMVVHCSCKVTIQYHQPRRVPLPQKRNRIKSFFPEIAFSGKIPLAK